MNSRTARYHKVSATGHLLPADATEWEGVYIPALGLIVSADPLPCGRKPWKEAMAAAEGATLCGDKCTRAMSRSEYAYILEDERAHPAVDGNYFRGPYGWEWTSTPYAGNPSGAAWFVNLDGGYSSWFNHSFGSLVRAVRAGQPLGLLESEVA